MSQDLHLKYAFALGSKTSNDLIFFQIGYFRSLTCCHSKHFAWHFALSSSFSNLSYGLRPKALNLFHILTHQCYESYTIFIHVLYMTKHTCLIFRVWGFLFVFISSPCISWPCWFQGSHSHLLIFYCIFFLLIFFHNCMPCSCILPLCPL